jgi:hypothetical protein
VVIVDTTVWIDYFHGNSNPETDWLDAELDRQRLGLVDIILCEVLQGVRDDAAAKKCRASAAETGGVRDRWSRPGHRGGLELSNVARPRTDGSKDHRLSHCHFLHSGAVLIAASRSRLRWVREVPEAFSHPSVMNAYRHPRPKLSAGPAYAGQ